MINSNFVILGLILQLIGGWGYLVDTLKGKIQPNKVSWFLWTLAPLIAFAAEIKQGVGIQSIMTFSVGFVPLVIFIASFFNRKSFWKLARLDFSCGLLSLLGLLFWYLTQSGNIAIFFSILSDGLASVPTIIKSYREPESESGGVYFFGIINAGIALLTIKDWNFAHYSFPLYILFVDVLIFVLIKFRLGKKLDRNMSVKL